jgi:hypothetical protein
VLKRKGLGRPAMAEESCAMRRELLMCVWGERLGGTGEGACGAVWSRGGRCSTLHPPVFPVASSTLSSTVCITAKANIIPTRASKQIQRAHRLESSNPKSERWSRWNHESELRQSGRISTCGG